MRLVPAAVLSVLILVFALVIHPAPALSSSGNVPLDSDVYRSLDVLTSFGLLRSHLAGTRPITWAEAHRLLEEARENIKLMEGEKKMVAPAIRGALKVLEKRIYDRLTGGVRAGTGPVYAAVHDPGILVEYLEGSPSPIPGIKASQHVLIYNNGGIDPGEGTTMSVLAEGEGSLGPFHLQFFPRLSTAEEDREVVQRGSLRVGEFWGLELIAAKENLWWGQGTHGGLFLTNNAAPLPMLHLSTPHPSVLPWVFRYLGPFRFELFFSQLEEDRAVPEPFFMGIRTNFRPAYTLELGMNIMVMVGGEGRPDVSFGDLFEILFGENEVDGVDRSNKIAGFDLRLNLPGWQCYLEFGGEDEAGGLPSKMAGLLGMYFPELTRNVDLRVEYTDLAYTEEIARVWYRHGVYTDGYTYNGRILGHHVGGGGRDLFAETTFRVGERGRGRVGVDFEERGVHFQPAIERHAQVMAGWEGPVKLGEIQMDLDLSLAVDQVTNSGYLKGEEETNGYVSVGIKGKI